MIRWLALLLLAFAGPLAAQSTMPPAPYAYTQLADPCLLYTSPSPRD